MSDPVIVVGAGLAGLACARTLRRAGRPVVVVEARDRVGGRLERGVLSDGTPVELGGQWLGPGQNRMYELVAELGLETFRTWNDEGAVLVDLLGRQSRMKAHKGAVAHLGPFVLADLGQGLARFRRAAARVDLERPWASPDARELDGQTFESWIRRTLRTAAGRAYVRVACEAVFAADAGDVSLLHALFYTHSGGGLETLLSTDAGAQQDRVVGGSVRIAEALADELDGHVRLSSPVRLVAHDAGGVSVELRGGESIEGAQVVLTLPPTLAGRLEYDPVLPPWRDQLTQRLPAGSAIKVHAAYDEPFWRADGLNGQAASDRGPVKVTFDNSPPSGSPGVLVGFIEGRDAREWCRRDADERRSAVLECFVRYVGERAADPRDYLERDWAAEEFTRGCYGAHFTPGVWTSLGAALREPIGRVHFAGAECSPVWNGYMEGAVRSGEHVAAEIGGRVVSGGAVVVLVAVAVLFAIEWYAVHTEQSDMEVLTKPVATSSVISLALVAGILERDWGVVMLVGLGFGILGDVLLLSSKESFFTAGMLAFLGGHLCYVVGFALMGFTPGAWLVVCVLAVLGCLVVGRSLLPTAVRRGGAALAVPLALYMVALATMTVLAGATGQWPVALGAVLFLVGDTILAYDRFVRPVRHGRLALMVAYLLGQLGIVVGAALAAE